MIFRASSVFVLAALVLFPSSAFAEADVQSAYSNSGDVYSSPPRPPTALKTNSGPPLSDLPEPPKFAGAPNTAAAPDPARNQVRTLALWGVRHTSGRLSSPPKVLKSK